MSSGGRFFAAVGITLLTALVLVSAPQPAQADYRFCNATSYVLQGAIAAPHGDTTALRGSDAGAELAGAESQVGTNWTTQGWSEVRPGECVSALRGPVVKGDYYVFARSIDAHQGPIKFFSGNFSFCTLPDTFALEVRDNCAARGYDSFDFIRVAVKAGEEWVTNFGEPRDFTMAQARIAGAQRLLRDNGLRVPKIDGYAAKNTNRAVMAFQRASGTKATGVIDDGLIEALVAGAKREQEKFGLNLCNKTDHLIWAAVALSRADEETSSGWIRVSPNTCVRAIKDKLEAKPYYVYAEATDNKGAIVTRAGRRLIWSGREPFCVKTTRFDIKGREACAMRGYDERPFIKLDTGGKATYKFDLE